MHYITLKLILEGFVPLDNIDFRSEETILMPPLHLSETQVEELNAVPGHVFSGIGDALWVFFLDADGAPALAELTATGESFVENTHENSGDN